MCTWALALVLAAGRASTCGAESIKQWQHAPPAWPPSCCRGMQCGSSSRDSRLFAERCPCPTPALNRCALGRHEAVRRGTKPARWSGQLWKLPQSHRHCGSAQVTEISWCRSGSSLRHTHHKCIAPKAFSFQIPQSEPNSVQIPLSSL